MSNQVASSNCCELAQCTHQGWGKALVAIMTCTYRQQRSVLRGRLNHTQSPFGFGFAAKTQVRSSHTSIVSSSVGTCATLSNLGDAVTDVVFTRTMNMPAIRASTVNELSSGPGILKPKHSRAHARWRNAGKMHAPKSGAGTAGQNDLATTHTHTLASDPTMQLCLHRLHSNAQGSMCCCHTNSSNSCKHGAMQILKPANALFIYGPTQEQCSAVGM
jgi:hypothetical protein